MPSFRCITLGLPSFGHAKSVCAHHPLRVSCCQLWMKLHMHEVDKPLDAHFLPTSVVLNLFYISYQIYPQYIQWCSFIENAKSINSYSLEWFIEIYIGCSLWFNKFTPLEDEIYPWLWTTALRRSVAFENIQCFRLCDNGTVPKWCAAIDGLHVNACVRFNRSEL